MSIVWGLGLGFTGLFQRVSDNTSKHIYGINILKLNNMKHNKNRGRFVKMSTKNLRHIGLVVEVIIIMLIENTSWKLSNMWGYSYWIKTSPRPSMK